MTPLEALEGATRLPAEVMGCADSLGTIAPGMVADLVLLDGDPTEDIANVRRIDSVFLAGKVLTKFDREQLLAQVLTAEDLRANDWLRHPAGRQGE